MTEQENIKPLKSINAAAKRKAHSPSSDEVPSEQPTNKLPSKPEEKPKKDN